MNRRIENLRSRLDALGVGTFLVSEPVNVAYLTGLESTNAAVLVRRDRVLLLTDGRYIEAARSLDGIEALQADRELAGWLGARIGELAEPPVAFESNRLTYAGYEVIAAGGVELRPAACVLENLRAVKDDAELAAIRRSAAVTAAAFERIVDEPFVGRREAEVAWAMEQALHESGGRALAFPVIIASGPNAAVPHHRPGPRTIEPGDIVIVDAGATVDGYCSDCTRTFSAGALPDELRRAYKACRAVQETALARVRAGADAQALDAAARGELESAGYEVLHGLGHGVGREIHELPVLRPTARGSLVPANVVTVEPGVYLSGRGGVRIEDLVIVTDDGPEVVTPFTKDLVAVA